MGKKKLVFSGMGWGEWAVLILFVAVIGFVIYAFVNSLINPSSSKQSYGSSCDEEWDTHGHHQRRCDREYDDYDPEPEGYDEWLNERNDDYRRERELEEAENRYFEEMYGGY